MTTPRSAGPLPYEAWRITWQSPESAARAAYALYLSALMAAWQPISTAPLDRKILLSDPGLSAPVIGYWNPTSNAWAEYPHWQADLSPTHWMPLPARIEME